MAALRGRLRAWWQGEGHPPPAAPAKAPASSAPPAARPARDLSVPYWTSERIDLVQRIWGREHISPGGEAYARRLVKPLALNPSFKVAEVGSGVGGAARAMHRSSGVWLKAYEPCPELAQVGMALSSIAGLSKQAPIEPIDLSRPELQRNAYDRLILRDVLHTAGDKIGVLRLAADALKAKGQLLVTDFVLKDGVTMPEQVKLWAEHEPRASQPWSMRVMQEALEDLRLTIQGVEDETGALRQMIIDGWKAFQANLRGDAIPPEERDVLIDEGERWARCAAALDNGALHYMRIIASR